MRNYKRWLVAALFVIMGLLFSMSDYTSVQAADKDPGTYYLLAKTGKKIAIYKKPNTESKKLAKLSATDEVIIRQVVVKQDVKWCKVIYLDEKGKRQQGYTKLAPLTIVSEIELAITKTTKITQEVYTRKLPTEMSGKKHKLAKKTKVVITAVSIHNGHVWYKVTYTVKKKTYKGYVPASVCKTKISDEQMTFEKNLLKFPQSYKSQLVKLYKKHPNWTFIPVNTVESWSTALTAESKTGVNVITSVAPEDGSYSKWNAPFNYLSTSSDAYNWKTDTYTVFDGTRWYATTSEVIAYYMDPRNFLTEEGIYMFESMKYDKDIQTIEGVRAILKGSFMSGTFKVGKKTYDYAKVFMEAAKKTGVSPYFLAARSLMEVGSSGSGSVSGKSGYYNFYNIGANDSKEGKAVENGLKWASTGTSFMRPWTNPYKSIIGGAKYIKSYYVANNQYTAYFQKFNVINQGNLYLHQYQTSVYSAASESITKQKAYEELGIDEQALVFYIPVYSNMPESNVSLPQPSGNVNNYIKSISIKDTKTGKQYKSSLSPKFSYTTQSYTLTVPRSVSSVKITGSKSSKFSTLTGNGVYNLKAGKTKTITLTCTSQTGSSRSYTIKIKRK
jgi:beta-N-acetylglucosaminidase